MKYSYKDFITFFGRNRFDKELARFLKQFGSYRLASHLFPDDFTYFRETGTFTDYYCNDTYGFELLFEDLGFDQNLSGAYPKNLVLTEIIFYLEKLNEKNLQDGFLCTFDLNTMMKQAFPDKIFKGGLPGNILLNDNKKIITRKLGVPLIEDRKNNFDTFISGDYKLVIKVIYYEDTELVKFITLHPAEFDKTRKIKAQSSFQTS
jgi:hypothetical protein